MTIHYTFVLMLALGGACPALEGTLTPRPLDGDSDCPYGYLEYLPAGYGNGSAAHALVLSFHGKGGEGDGRTDLLSKLTHSGPAHLISGGRDFPAIVLCPQATTWYDVPQVDRFLTWARRRYRIDPQRVYLIGHSAGGSQVWNYAHAHPEVPAAIVPICGASDPENPQATKDPARLAALPVWSFHCFGDRTVNRRNTIRWMNGLARANDRTRLDLMEGYPGPAAGNASAVHGEGKWLWRPGATPGVIPPSRSCTLYADSGHDAWTRTYANDAVWDWLLAQRREESGR